MAGDTSRSRVSCSSSATVGAPAIRRVLKARKMPPAPQRHTGTTWRQFLHVQAAAMLAVGFYVECSVTLRRLSCLFVIEAGSRCTSRA